MNNIEYKYKYGEKVYYIDMEQIPTVIKCSTCLGSGKLTRDDGTKIICQTCKGKGKTSNTGSLKNVVRESSVQKILIYVDNREEIFYLLSDDRELSECCLYKTKEEAQILCDKENSKCIMGYGPISI